MKPARIAHVPSPHLAHTEQAADFQMEVAKTQQEVKTMSTDVKNLIDTFDHLPEAEQREAALEILRRTVNFDLPELSDEELVLNAEAMFLELDRREVEDG